MDQCNNAVHSLMTNSLSCSIKYQLFMEINLCNYSNLASAVGYFNNLKVKGLLLISYSLNQHVTIYYMHRKNDSEFCHQYSANLDESLLFLSS